MFGSESLVRIQGTIYALAPVVHGAPPKLGAKKQKGTHTHARVIKVFIPATEQNPARFETIPVISGNGIRGQCRRFLASHLAMELGVTPGELNQDVVYLLFCGGGLNKKKEEKEGKKEEKKGQNGKNKQKKEQIEQDSENKQEKKQKEQNGEDKQDVFDLKLRRQIREELPMIDLLGGAFRGQFLRGRLTVDFAVPKVYELADLYGEEDPKRLPTLQQLRLATTVDRGLIYARHVDPDIMPVLEVPVVLQEDALDDLEDLEDEENKNSGSLEDSPVAKEPKAENQPEAEDQERRNPRMVFSSDAIPAGTPLWHGFMLDDANEITRSCFNFMLQRFFDWGHIGGKGNTGHGLFRAEYAASDGSPVPGDASKYLKFVQDNKKEILQFLKALGNGKLPDA